MITQKWFYRVANKIAKLNRSKTQLCEFLNSQSCVKISYSINLTVLIYFLDIQDF
jgi:hypothetical protein